MPPAHKVEGFNPLCGDEVVLYLDVDPDTDTVRDIKIAGQGCSISQASTSMMSAAVKGKPLDEVRQLIRAFKALMSIHESKLEGEGDGSDLAAELEGVPARRPRGAPGRREVPGAHQVRHVGVEHPAAGTRRIRASSPPGLCGLLTSRARGHIRVHEVGPSSQWDESPTDREPCGRIVRCIRETG